MGCILLGTSATPLWEASGRHFDAAGACGRWFRSLEPPKICETTTAEHFLVWTFGRPQRPPSGRPLGAILTLLAHVDAAFARWPPLKSARTQQQSTFWWRLLEASATPLWEASGRHFNAAGACGRWFRSLEPQKICENTTAEHFGEQTFGDLSDPPLGGLWAPF